MPSLADRYELEAGRVFLSGVQALVRLPIEQMRRDRRDGLRTKAYITGYPGSPLSGYDIALRQIGEALDAHGIHHLPGQNEELAATTIMGTQMLDEHPHPDVDGVVAYWYGKGPGIDRSGDALKHGNFAGTSTNGAVVILSGEDHEAKSSSVPYQQEFAFEHLGIPVLYPATVTEFIEYGLHAAAMSRYSGCWVALKLVGPLCDGGEVVRFSSDLCPVELPSLEIDGKPFRKKANFKFFPVLNIETERQLYVERHAAARAYGRANGLNKLMMRGPADRIGIISAGKSYTDTRQALEDLGLDDVGVQAAGIRVAKIGMLYPLDVEFVRDFARGLEQIIVIEEKRDFLERQIGRAVCDLGPIRVLGKYDADGRPLFPVEGGMSSDMIAGLLGRVLGIESMLPSAAAERLDVLRQVSERNCLPQPRRTLNFCSGCPHNVSTLLAPGQIAWGAPGCHIFAAVMDKPEKRIEAVTQFGGEGLPWIGLAPFTTRKHIVQNLGDGSLLHSSYQNIRFAVSAGVNITFKILFNGVIANTGGQKSIGEMAIPTLVSHLALDGVARIVLIAKDPKRYRHVIWPAQVVVRAAAGLEASMQELAATAGTTILIYDGECANERRRRQKRGKVPAPTRFTVVNEDVCENCGNCGEVANCMSLQKVETLFGPKTQIHQSSCNQDFACIGGKCPSFVTVEGELGTRVRRPELQQIDVASIPEPQLPALSHPYNIYVPGLGGTGVLTANAILSLAATLDGSEVKSYDQTGAAQKWGAVLSSLIIAAPGQIPITNRVGLARADLYLALDLLAGVDRNNLGCCNDQTTRSVINTGLLPSGDMIRNPQLVMPVDGMVDTILAATGRTNSVVIDARRIAEGLSGDYMMANMVTMGAAYQAGLLPISATNIETSIRINGAQVEANILAFRAGRLSQHDFDRLSRMLIRPYATLADRTAARKQRDSGKDRRVQEAVQNTLQHLGSERTLEEQVRVRADDLIDYQSVDYALLYLYTVDVVAAAERKTFGPTAALNLTTAVARNLHKVMAYKDEYEVARLLTQSTFTDRIREMFTGTVRISFQLQPPFLRWFGLNRKVCFGPWIVPALKALARLKFLRGTVLDPFGRMEQRRQERQLVEWYVDLINDGVRHLTAANREVVLDLFSLPDNIRGYDGIKEQAVRVALDRALILRESLRPGNAPMQIKAAA